MAHATRKQRHEFIGLMYEHSPHEWRENDPPMFIQKQADLLMRYGATLARLAEELCNGYQTYDGKWDEKRTLAAEKKQARIELKAQQAAEAIGGKIITQGDPRGNVLKIIFPDGYTNDWGREGISVPTS
jgi:hypothetical protein